MKGLGSGCVRDEAVDDGLEIDDGPEDAIVEPAVRQHGEGALDRVPPGTGGGREVEGPARLELEPGPQLLMLVGRIIVQYDVDEPWSNGQTEGRITKLKLAKRQMYGRAKVDLLEARQIGAA